MSYIKILFPIIFLLLPYQVNTFANEFNNPNNWRNNTTIIKTLNTAPIISIENMRDVLDSAKKKIEFNGDVKLVTLKGGIKAVFKVDNDDLGGAYAEVAAFRISKTLGFPFIPPTVIRKINNEIGSLQLYVSTDIDLLQENVYKKALGEVNKEDLANLFLFYFIFGQCDTGPHNLLALKSDKLYLIAIDNSGIRSHNHVADYGELPFVRVAYSDKLNTNDWHKKFPFEHADTIIEVSEEKLKTIFRNKVPQGFYDRFKNQKQPFKYVVYQNGIWVQYHAFDKDFVRSFTKYFPQSTIKKIQQLNLKTLETIFDFPNKPESFNKNYLQQMLKRRDMIIEAYKNL